MSDPLSARLPEHVHLTLLCCFESNSFSLPSICKQGNSVREPRRRCCSCSCAYSCSASK
jgi:hypothetical protein